MIRGRVLDPSGQPTVEGHVYAAGQSSLLQFDADVREGGSFVLGPLVSDRFDIQATGGDDAESQSVVAKPGDADVVLQLRPGGTIRGRVILPATSPNASVSVLVAPCRELQAGNFSWHVHHGNDDGSFEFTGLEPGLYG